MFYQKSGFPEESELVVCTVTRIHHHSVFVSLDYYKKSAMLHISEISPGRIRNINDYVKEGKVIVCKVLSVNQDKGHVDVSLRRVSEPQRIQLMNKIKQEQTAEKIITFIAKENKEDAQKLYDKVHKKLSPDFEFLYDAFSGYVQGEYDLKESGLPEKLHTQLLDLIKQRIKPPLVEITAKLSLVVYSDDGLIQLKEAFSEAEKTDTENLKITYGGNGNYYFRVVQEDFKSAEKILSTAIAPLKERFDEKKFADFKFEKSEGKQIN